jgi:streptogramin lyase
VHRRSRSEGIEGRRANIDCRGVRVRLDWVWEWAHRPLRRGVGNEQASIKGTAYVHGIAAASGAIWVVAGGVRRVDPITGVTRDVRGLADADLVELAGGAGALWVVDGGSNEILRIDPRRGRITARIRVPGRAWGVTAGTHEILVLSVPHRRPVTGPRGTRLLQRLDPRTGRLSAARAQLNCDAGMAVGLGAVWTLDACTGSLSRRDTRSLRIERQRKLGVLSQTPALGFGSIWLASRSGVRRIDPTTLRTVAVIPARSLTVVVGDAAVWAFDPAHDVLRKIDPRTNRVVGKPITVPRGP